MNDFIEILAEKNIPYEIRDQSIIVEGEHVYLRSLTTLPDDVVFNNGGGVYLSSLTTLPEGVVFNNGGYVDLSSLTTLPDDVVFNNGGGVYLDSLENQTVKYQGKKIKIRYIDGYTMIIKSSKKVNDYIIMYAEYFRGAKADKRTCYIAERGGLYAHGENIQQAMSDCNIKYMQENCDVSDIVEKIKKKGIVTVEDYRLITGACAFGCQQFLKEKGITETEKPLNEVLDLVKDAYGGERFRKLFI